MGSDLAGGLIFGVHPGLTISGTTERGREKKRCNGGRKRKRSEETASQILSVGLLSTY